MIKGRELEAFEKAGRKIWPAVTIRLSSKKFMTLKKYFFKIS